MKAQFSLTEKEGIHVDDRQAKIEMVNCPLDKVLCVEHLSVINKYYGESNEYHLKKDYQRSIEALKLAFNSTYKINNSSCLKCAELFRSTIISSLENIHLDLERMSTGMFKSKRFQSSFILAALVLDEFKKKK